MVFNLIDGSVDKPPQHLGTVVWVEQDVVPGPAVAQLQAILLQCSATAQLITTPPANWADALPPLQHL